MGSLLISHTTCLNWYDRLANFDTMNPCFDQLAANNSRFFGEKMCCWSRFRKVKSCNHDFR
ncbi:hypothetical protein CRG93_13760 [Escherichia sp. E2593]|nr:hypothetical protein CRG93_13760 [Escherichia sp. E2593]